MEACPKTRWLSRFSADPPVRSGELAARKQELILCLANRISSQGFLELTAGQGEGRRSSPAGDNPMAEMLTAKEVARYLQVSVNTIYKRARAGQLPAFRVGNVWVFPKSRLERWLKETQAGKRRTRPGRK